jgi:hypothetical protein
MHCRARTCWFACAALLVCIDSARAQTESEAEARAQRLFDQGRELYEAHRLLEALNAFIESDRIAPTPNVAFNIAQLCTLLGRSEDAFNWYQRFLAFDLEPERAAQGEALAAELRAHVAVLDISVAPADAVTSIDRADLDRSARSPRWLAVTPGAHTIAARADGYVPREVDVEAVRGALVRVAVTLDPMPGTLSITSDPSDAVVSLNATAKALGRTPLRIELPAQKTKLVLRLDGYEEREAEVDIRPNAVSSLSLKLQPRASWHTPPVDRSAGAKEHSAGLGSWRWIGYGAAAALLTTGLTIGVIAINKQEAVSADPKRAGKDEVDRLNLAADLTGALGLATAAVTLTLDFTL